MDQDKDKVCSTGPRENEIKMMRMVTDNKRCIQSAMSVIKQKT